jgi:hypothetical protein
VAFIEHGGRVFRLMAAPQQRFQGHAKTIAATLGARPRD